MPPPVQYTPTGNNASSRYGFGTWDVPAAFGLNASALPFKALTRHLRISDSIPTGLFPWPT